MSRAGALLSGLWESLLISAARPAAAPLSATPRILTMGYMGVGDFLLFSSFLKVLKQKYPQSRITVVTGPYSAAKELAPFFPQIDETVEIDWKNLTGAVRRRALDGLAAKQFDLYVASYFTPVRFFLPLLRCIPVRAGLIREIKYPEIIENTFSYIAWQFRQWFIEEDWFRRAALTIRVPVTQAPLHELEKLKRLAAALNLPTAGWPVPQLDMTSALAQKAQARLENAGIAALDKFIVVHPSASSVQNWKSWPPDRYQKTVLALLEKYPLRAILLGTAEEEAGLETTAPALLADKRVLSLMGKTSLAEAAAILKRANLFLGTDSGLGHLAIAVGTTAVRIFGPSDQPGFAAWAPGGHEDVFVDLDCRPCLVSGVPKPGQLNYTCCPHKNCLNTLSVERVLGVVEKKIA